MRRDGLDLTKIDKRTYWRGVSTWANSFDAKYRNLLWVIGYKANKDGEPWYISIGDIRKEMRTALWKRPGKKTGGPSDIWVPAYSTIKTYLKELRAFGVLETEQTMQVKRGKTVWGANLIYPNLTLRVVNQIVESHDFLESLTVVSPGPATDEPRIEPRTSHNLCIKPKLVMSTDPKSEPRYRASARGSTPLPVETEPEVSAESLEKDYGVDVRHLVRIHGARAVAGGLKRMYVAWEDAGSPGLPAGRPSKSDTRAARLAYMQDQGGEPALVESIGVWLRHKGLKTAGVRT